MLRPRRMVEPLDDRQESFFCGPPGKRQPDKFIALVVVLFLVPYQIRRAPENSWEDETGFRCSANQRQAGWGWGTGEG